VTRLRRFGSLMLALLRELADESAYQRYLAANRRKHSPQEWRKFSDERLRAKYFRPKCC
jgi:predicted secreted acid phosphatase